MAAQDAELQLKVGLDLAFFKQQLSGLGQISAGQSIPIQFDRTVIASQFRALQRYLSNKTFTVRIESNTLDTLAEKAKKLRDNLNALDGTAIAVKVGAEAASLSQRDVNKIRTDLARQISAQSIRVPISARVDLPEKPSRQPVEGRTYASQLRNQIKEAIAGRDGIVKIPITASAEIAEGESATSGAKAREFIKKAILGESASLLIPLSTTPAITAADVATFKKEVEAKFSGITVKIKAGIEANFASSQIGLAGLQKYMKEQGLSGGNVPGAQGMQVGAASMARRTLFEDVISKATAKEMKGMLSTAEVAGRSGLKTKEQMRARLLELDDILMERILGSLKMQMSEPPRKVGRSFLDQVARAIFWMAGVDPEYLRRQAAQRKALPPIDFPAVLPRRKIEIGPSSTGRALPPAPPTSAGMIAGARPPIGLLPEITTKGQLDSVIRALISGLQRRELPGQGGALAIPPDRARKQALEALQQQLDQMLRIVEVSVKETSAGLQKSLDVFSYFVQSLRGAEKRAENATRILRQSKFDAAVSSFLKGLETIVRSAEARLRIAQVRVGDMGTRAQRAIGPARERLMLPAQTSGRPFRESFSSPYSTGPISNRGDTRAEYLARREQEARLRSEQRSAAILAGTGGMSASGNMPPPVGVGRPITPPSSALVYQPRGGLARTGAGGTAPARAGIGAMPSAIGTFASLPSLNLPGPGVVREMGEEFAFAAKQIVLFGSVYKALAFLQNFPAQVVSAITALQSFNNTLAAISPSAEAAADSNKFVMDIVSKYNVPLASARTGFAKLYASMQPAGFNGEDIEGLFTGVSKAAAVFGLSADKVDRVNYAFAQMASKGQVMSEELKGQLGDVLPGAMAIFAEAAGFKGPDAISKFSEELEAGRYKGLAMVDLLNNVSVVMNTKFASGAEGASKTFQGAINKMQTSLTLFYEAFEPAAIQFAGAVVTPLTNGLKILSDGFNAFFTGTAAKTLGGAGIARELESLKPTFEGLRSNLVQLVPVFQDFGQTLLGVARTALAIAGNPIVGYLAKVYITALPISVAFNLITTALRSGVAAFIVYNSQLLLGNTRMAAFRLTMALTGTTAGVTAAGIRGVTLAVRGLMASTVVGAAIVGLGILAERLMNAGNQASAARQKMIDFADSVKMAGEAGNVAEVQSRLTRARSEASRIQEARKVLELIKGGKGQVTSAQAAELRALGLASNMGFSRGRATRGSNLDVQINAPGAVAANIAAAQKGYLERQTQIIQAERALSQARSKAGQQERQLIQIRASGQSDEEVLKSRKQALEILSGKLEDQLSIEIERLRVEQQRRELEARGNETEILKIRYETDRKELELQIQMLERTLQLRRELAASGFFTKGGKADKEEIAAFEAKSAATQTSIDIRRLQIQRLDLKYRGEAADLQDKLSEKARKDAEDRAKESRDAAQAIVDLKIEMGLVSSEEAAVLKLGQKYADLIEKYPSLTKAQRGEVAKLIENNQKTLTDTKEELDLLYAITAEEKRRIELRREGYKPEVISQIIGLEKLRDNIKQAREIIDGFVEQTSSDYKGFMKDIITGEDAADALKKFQEGLRDRTLTIFLDFAMAPVEAFMKETFTRLAMDNIFGGAKKPSTTPIEASDKNTVALEANTQAVVGLTAAINRGGAIPPLPPAPSLPSGVVPIQVVPWSGDTAMPGGSPSLPSRPVAAGETAATALAATNQALQKTGDAAAATANKVGQAGAAMAPTGSQGQQFTRALGQTVQGIGMAAASIMGIMAGISQMKQGGVSGVLGGIGSILMGVGGAIGGFSGLFKGGGAAAVAAPVMAANGAVWKGGFTAFADGGVVRGPTLGLVGEGKYSEAIVPLPDGKSIPVKMGRSSSREMLSSGQRQAAPTVLSMNFQTTKFGSTEYVDVDQLQAAMAETRRLAAKDGATRGASLALDRLQNSPSARRKVGIG